MQKLDPFWMRGSIRISECEKTCLRLVIRLRIPRYIPRKLYWYISTLCFHIVESTSIYMKLKTDRDVCKHGSIRRSTTVWAFSTSTYSRKWKLQRVKIVTRREILTFPISKCLGVFTPSVLDIPSFHHSIIHHGFIILISINNSFMDPYINGLISQLTSLRILGYNIYGI